MWTLCTFPASRRAWNCLRFTRILCERCSHVTGGKDREKAGNRTPVTPSHPPISQRGNHVMTSTYPTPQNATSGDRSLRRPPQRAAVRGRLVRAQHRRHGGGVCTLLADRTVSPFLDSSPAGACRSCRTPSGAFGPASKTHWRGNGSDSRATTGNGRVQRVPAGSVRTHPRYQGRDQGTCPAIPRLPSQGEAPRRWGRVQPVHVRRAGQRSDMNGWAPRPVRRGASHPCHGEQAAKARLYPAPTLVELPPMKPGGRGFESLRARRI